jgi:poly(3-hydroxybutyrate) depolymerase
MPSWDQVQQNIRILCYGIAGGGVVKGWYDEQTAVMIGSTLFGVAAWAWWKFWDSKRVEAPVPTPPAA